MQRPIDRDPAHLHPSMRRAVELLLQELHQDPVMRKAELDWRLFEGYRPPHHQLELVAAGMSRAAPFHSAHNFGLAVDLVPYPWTWADGLPWERMRALAREAGLATPISWDKPHLEHPAWESILPSFKTVARL